MNVDSCLFSAKGKEKKRKKWTVRTAMYEKDSRKEQQTQILYKVYAHKVKYYFLICVRKYLSQMSSYYGEY